MFTNILEYYRFSNPLLRFSYYSRLNAKNKVKFLDNLYQRGKPLVDIYAFCLMPNHYHILLKQVSDRGITNFVRLSQNSYARYLNTKTKRFGSVFQSPFKAVRIETDEQFIHVARYIHLNPLTSYIIGDFSTLESYEQCSYVDYLSKNHRRFINTDPLMDMFKDKNGLTEFTQDNLDYQRELEKIKHLTLN